MTQLVKASLCEVSADARGSEIGTPIDVQFNPTSLRMQITNRTTGGNQAGSQVRQRPGDGVVTVSFDLVFDTADEGTTDAPVPVTRKTMIVENFVRPRGNTPSRQAPPRVQFKWGSFLVQGTMESVNVDLDLFAANGTPLRAKVAVSIKGQDPRYQYNPATPASGGGLPPGPLAAPPGAPGTTGGAGVPSGMAQAMPGESLAQLASRNGLDPSAWRSLAAGISNPFSLKAGFEIGLPGSLPTGSQLSGKSSQGNDPRQAAAQLPLVSQNSIAGSGSQQVTAGVAGSGGPRAAVNPVQAGQAVTRQGGLGEAIQQVRGVGQQQAVTASRSAFGLVPDAAAVAIDRPFGASVPLRPRRGGIAAPKTVDATTPSWQALPAGRRSSVVQLGGSKPAGCGCCNGSSKRKG